MPRLHRESRIGAPSLAIFIAGLSLLVFLAERLYAAGASFAAGPEAVLSGGQSSAPTANPGGPDPWAAVRQVEQNRAQAAGTLLPPGPSRLSPDALTPAFELGGEPVYGHAGGGQGLPAVAFAGTSYLVVWFDGRPATTNSSGSSWVAVYGARLDTAGNVLDPIGISIAARGSEPAVASDGTNFLVVWTENNDIHGARLNQDGDVLDAGGMTIAAEYSSQGRPSVAFDGVNFLVTWDDGRNSGLREIFGARVAPDGTVLDPGGFVISSVAQLQWGPEVAYDGTNYLVVWERGPSHDKDVYGSRVTPAGVVLDGDGFAISTGSTHQRSPRVTSDGAGCFVAWADYRNGRDIYGARVGSDGSVLDPAGIPLSASASISEVIPALAFDGTNYLVTWSDYRGSLTDIYAARVSTGPPPIRTK